MLNNVLEYIDQDEYVETFPALLANQVHWTKKINHLDPMDITSWVIVLHDEITKVSYK